MIPNTASQHLTTDDHLLTFIDRSRLLKAPGHQPKICQFQTFNFDDRDMRILDTRNALLNDICMNGLAIALQALFLRDPTHSAAAERCAIFSTYDLNRIRYKAPDTELWRSTYRRDFWSKPVWIVPIHRPSQCHWVLAVVYHQLHEVHLFDSLAGRSSWLRDAQVSLGPKHHRPRNSDFTISRTYQFLYPDWLN